MPNSESILLQNLNITDGLFEIYNPRENKGLSYDAQERESLGLLGHLPHAVFTMKEQVSRAYLQYQRFDGLFEKSIYLRCLHDTNEHLFYSLVKEHLTEMIPVIYTPTVGEAVQKYSLEFRRPRGLYIAYPDRYKMLEILKQRTNKNVDIIVASDSQGVLGIGDQGVGGMEIPVAKLMVYTLCAGISPRNHLPIVLDVGTDNQELLDDPLYVGWRNKRISGDAYYEMMDLFIAAVKEVFPKTFLHWEDFGRDNAIYNLDKYREVLPSFNDDIQGTAAASNDLLNDGFTSLGDGLSETNGLLNDINDTLQPVDGQQTIDTITGLMEQTPEELGIQELQESDTSFVSTGANVFKTAQCNNPVFDGHTIDLCSHASRIVPIAEFIIWLGTLLFIWNEVHRTLRRQS